MYQYAGWHPTRHWHSCQLQIHFPVLYQQRVKTKSNRTPPPPREAEENEAHLSTSFGPFGGYAGPVRFRNLGFCSWLWNEMCSRKPAIPLVPHKQAFCHVRNLSLPCTGFYASFHPTSTSFAQWHKFSSTTVRCPQTQDFNPYSHPQAEVPASQINNNAAVKPELATVPNSHCLLHLKWYVPTCLEIQAKYLGRFLNEVLIM